jgi:two-component system NarL family sensor kinase
VASLDTGAIVAEVSHLDRPENLYEEPLGKLLEVYLPVRAPDGTPLLFEAYFRYELVDRSAGQLWRTFAPLTLGALLLLELIQLPLAWSLARSLRQRHDEREGLLERAIEASDVERRKIASDLHDGAVQDLAGAALTLSAAARRDGIGEADRDLLQVSAAQIRDAIKDLRSLIVDLYPPDFDDLACASAIGELLGRVADRGLETSLDADGVSVEPNRAVCRLLYRAAQEAIRNALAHAEPSSVGVVLASDARGARLTVTDDGRGFDDAELHRRRTEGHVGLVALRGLVTDAGGTLTVDSRPGEGTTMTVEVPR